MIKLAKTQYNRDIKIWRYNGGREYHPTEIKELADYIGMLVEESTPYTLK